MIISIDAENIFDKIQRIFMIKILERVGLEGTYINIIQSVYKKPSINIILNERSWSNPTEVKKMTILLLFNIALEVPLRTIRQEKEIEGIQMGNETKLP